MMAEDKKKICPLRHQDIQIPETQCCVEKQCAWWDSTNTIAGESKCSILAMAVTLRWISRRLKDGG